jgi:iron(III) transport system substrate-binding protein
MSAPDPTRRSSGWPKDEFGRRERISQFWWVGLIVIAGLLVSFSLWKNSGADVVVVYCAQDQLYAEPIFRQFEDASVSRIRVRAVFDSEAVKTVGLANRLLGETNHPRCDVFWGNEELRTRQLAARQVFRETNGWAAFGYRSRRIVINTNHVSFASAPHSLLDLTNRAWEGRLALAYPQFGTTATHFHALRQRWGDALWEAWCRGLVQNKSLLADGNSVVVKLVGQGQAWVGLTDSDDIAAGQRQGFPIAGLPMNGETLLIPNTVAVVRGAPNPAAAEHLFSYLQRRPVAESLMAAQALEGVNMEKIGVPTLPVKWDALLTNLETTNEKLTGIFLR